MTRTRARKRRQCAVNEVLLFLQKIPTSMSINGFQLFQNHITLQRGLF
jgi:hypothetical protein